MCVSQGKSLNFFLYPFFPESPNWQFSKQKYKPGTKTLKTFAEKTKTDIDDEFINTVIEEIETDLEERKAADEFKENYNLTDIFKHKNMRIFGLSIGKFQILNGHVTCSLRLHVLCNNSGLLWAYFQCCPASW